MKMSKTKIFDKKLKIGRIWMKPKFSGPPWHADSEKNGLYELHQKRIFFIGKNKICCTRLTSPYAYVTEWDLRQI